MPLSTWPCWEARARAEPKKKPRPRRASSQGEHDAKEQRREKAHLLCLNMIAASLEK